MRKDGSGDRAGEVRHCASRNPRQFNIPSRPLAGSSCGELRTKNPAHEFAGVRRTQPSRALGPTRKPECHRLRARPAQYRPDWRSRATARLKHVPCEETSRQGALGTAKRGTTPARIPVRSRFRRDRSRARPARYCNRQSRRPRHCWRTPTAAVPRAPCPTSKPRATHA